MASILHTHESLASTCMCVRMTASRSNIMMNESTSLILFHNSPHISPTVDLAGIRCLAQYFVIVSSKSYATLVISHEA